MMFNLKDLQPTHDVSISVGFLDGFMGIHIHFSGNLEIECCQLSEELTSVKIKNAMISKTWISVSVGNYDACQLAERIAGSLEEAGMKTQRLVTPVRNRIPGSGINRSATQEVQSFILA